MRPAPARYSLSRSLPRDLPALRDPPHVAVTKPGIPNEYALSTSCYGTRLRTIEDQAFAAVAMGFRRLELGLSDQPVPLNGFDDMKRETGLSVNSVVCGCLNPRSENMAGTKLASTDEDDRERAIISVRRHARLAQQFECPVVILRGVALEDESLIREGTALHARLVKEGPEEEVHEAILEFVTRVHREGQHQLEHLCRSIHTVATEFPDTNFVLEPGMHFTDLLSFHSMGLVLDDLARHNIRYWHDTGSVHLREVAGLPGQGQWLDTFASRMVGIHLNDATGTRTALPPGLGEVDFRLVQEYTPSAAERVVEIDSSHGRTEILAAVQFLVDRGF